MKALEILRDNYITVVSDTDTEMALYYQDHIQIAIKELEKLQKEIIEKDLKIKDLESYFDGIHTVKKK